jgi:DNA topoisomerase-1
VLAQGDLFSDLLEIQQSCSIGSSARLHNTPTVARNSYIHPDVIKLAGAAPVAVDAVKRSGLFAAEKRLLGFLTTR